jgi:Holliday junction resolvasome RuvABC endonuclease subunit
MQQSTTILGVDIGLKMGWAITHNEQRIDSGTLHLKGKNWESRGTAFLRAGHFFRQQLVQYQPSLVSFETVKRFMSSDAALIYGGIVGQLMATCEDLKINYVGYSPTEIKKLATDKGKASKEEMIEAAHKLFNYLPGDDNEADALHICRLAHKNFGA